MVLQRLPRLSERRLVGRSLSPGKRHPRGGEPKRFDLVTSDRGTASGEFHLAEEPPLGLYRLRVRLPAGGRVLRTQWAAFRVEEYKKPEFEVKVEAPTEPVKLGEKITARIVARYYFGAPVTEGKVKYKVLRTPASERWFAPAP